MAGRLVEGAEVSEDARLLELLDARGWSIATAESLTGGLVCARLVDIPGASRVVHGGACTYSFEAKSAILGLDLDDLRARGAVRESVAHDMAIGALRAYGASIAVATTGVAGPGPDSFGMPEGTVFLACALRGYSRGTGAAGDCVEDSGPVRVGECSVDSIPTGAGERPEVSLREVSACDVRVRELRLTGSRAEIRVSAAEEAVRLALEVLLAHGER